MDDPSPDDELKRILSLPASERYEYLLQRVAEGKRLWSLGDGEGFALLRDEAGIEHLPVWPEEVFAAVCAPDGFPLKPQPIELLAWVEHWVPDLLGGERRVAAFPTPDGAGVSLPPGQFRDDLEAELIRLKHHLESSQKEPHGGH
jgi:hypothetical protein